LQPIDEGVKCLSEAAQLVVGVEYLNAVMRLATSTIRSTGERARRASVYPPAIPSARAIGPEATSTVIKSESCRSNGSKEVAA